MAKHRCPSIAPDIRVCDVSIGSEYPGPETDDFQPDGKTKGLIAVLCACSVMLTLLVMALNWTPLSNNYISGVQGRYFLPLLVPAIWLFRTRIVQVDGSIRKYILLFEGTANILILVYLFTNTMI